MISEYQKYVARREKAELRTWVGLMAVIVGGFVAVVVVLW